MQIFAIANQKGGVGKTNLVANVAAELAAFRKRVVVVDLDPQSTLTAWMVGPAKAASMIGVAEVLGYGAIGGSTTPTLAEVLVPVSAFGVRLAGAVKSKLKVVEVQMTADVSSLMWLNRALVAPIDADYVLIDCPPNPGTLSTAALFAADAVIVPMSAQTESLYGLAQIRETIARVQSMHELRITGVVATRVKRTRISKGVVEQMGAMVGDLAMKTVIREATVLEQLFAKGIPIRVHAPDSEAHKDYRAFARELMQRGSGSLRLVANA